MGGGHQHYSDLENSDMIKRILLGVAAGCFVLCTFVALGDASVKWSIEVLAFVGATCFVVAHW